jgi:hypothetical protein
MHGLWEDNIIAEEQWENINIGRKRQIVAERNIVFILKTGFHKTVQHDLYKFNINGRLSCSC